MKVKSGLRPISNQRSKGLQYKYLIFAGSCRRKFYLAPIFLFVSNDVHDPGKHDEERGFFAK